MVKPKSKSLFKCLKLVTTSSILLDEPKVLPILLDQTLMQGQRVVKLQHSQIKPKAALKSVVFPVDAKATPYKTVKMSML